MEENKGDFFAELKEELKSYVKLRMELFRISLYEKIARVTAQVFIGMMMVSLFLFVLVFASMMAGFYFSQLTGSSVIGFGIISAFYLLLLLIVVTFRKQLFEKRLMDKMIEILFENDSNNRP